MPTSIHLYTYISEHLYKNTGADELMSRGLRDEAIFLFADGSGDKVALWSRRRGGGIGKAG